MWENCFVGNEKLHELRRQVCDASLLCDHAEAIVFMRELPSDECRAAFLQLAGEGISVSIGGRSAEERVVLFHGFPEDVSLEWTDIQSFYRLLPSHLSMQLRTLLHCIHSPLSIDALRDVVFQMQCCHLQGSTFAHRDCLHRAAVQLGEDQIHHLSQIMNADVEPYFEELPSPIEFYRIALERILTMVRGVPMAVQIRAHCLLAFVYEIIGDYRSALNHSSSYRTLLIRTGASIEELLPANILAAKHCYGIYDEEEAHFFLSEATDCHYLCMLREEAT